MILWRSCDGHGVIMYWTSHYLIFYIFIIWISFEECLMIIWWSYGDHLKLIVWWPVHCLIIMCWISVDQLLIIRWSSDEYLIINLGSSADYAESKIMIRWSCNDLVIKSKDNLKILINAHMINSQILSADHLVDYKIIIRWSCYDIVI